MRVIDTEDAFTWLPRAEGDGLVTVLPDAHEIGMESIVAYRAWFNRAVELCFQTVPDGPVVFMQTDRLHGGRWIDKAFLVGVVAATLPKPRPLVWHKIAIRRDVGRIDLHRPTYSHVLAYGPARPGTRTPDIIRRGPTLWQNGAGIDASWLVVEWLRENGVRVLLNPFCGLGTIVAIAEEAGLDVRGCDLDPERADRARAIRPLVVPPVPTPDVGDG